MNGETRIIRVSWLAVALLPLWAGVAGAQIEPNQSVAPNQGIVPAQPAQAFHPEFKMATELIGAKVVDSRNKWLGTIEDIVLTPDRNAIDYAVLSYGGVWGIPQKLFAVPWSQFQVEPQGKTLVLNVNRRELQSAKGLGKGYWPDTANEAWLSAAQGAAAPGPLAGQPATDMRYRRLSRLLDMNVQNGQGQPLGTLQDAVVDVRGERVVYGILFLGSECPIPDRNLVAVPWPALEILPASGTAQLNVDRQTLEAMAFNTQNVPPLASAQYSRQLYERFQVAPYWEALGYVPAEGAAPEPQAPAAEPGR